MLLTGLPVTSPVHKVLWIFSLGRGWGGIPSNLWWGCAVWLSKSLPYTKRKANVSKYPPGFLVHNWRTLLGAFKLKSNDDGDGNENGKKAGRLILAKQKQKTGARSLKGRLALMGVKILSHYLYLPFYALLRVRFCVIISFFRNKDTTAFCKHE